VRLACARRNLSLFRRRKRRVRLADVKENSRASRLMMFNQKTMCAPPTFVLFYLEQQAGGGG
jgi:hypothetical protein